MVSAKGSRDILLNILPTHRSLSPCSFQASRDIRGLSFELPELVLRYVLSPKMRCHLLLAALLCGLASATARDPSFRGRALLQQAPNCARITNCNTCYNAKNDDSVTVLLCRVCNTGYRPTAEANECGKLASIVSCNGSSVSSESVNASVLCSLGRI